MKCYDSSVEHPSLTKLHDIGYLQLAILFYPSVDVSQDKWNNNYNWLNDKDSNWTSYRVLCYHQNLLISNIMFVYFYSKKMEKNWPLD